MMCECYQTIKAEVAAMYARQYDDPTITADAKNIAINLSDKGDKALYIPFRIKGAKRPFNNKNGKESLMFPAYCPWCGTKIDKGE